MYDGDQLAVLPPELLPNSLGNLADCLAQGREVAWEALQPLTQSPRYDPVELLPIARNALERIRAVCAAPVRIESDPCETPMNRENDKALYIFRTSGVPARVLLSSAVQVYVEFLDELVTAGTDLTAEDVGCLHLQFTVIFELLSGRLASYDPEQQLPTLAVAALSFENHVPLRRWVRGHHVFIVLQQWQVIFFQCFRRSVEQSDRREKAGPLLKLLILTLRASVQAFRFTGEFSKEAYAEIVRRTLMPPAAPDGMSGVNWRDHQYLLKSFTKLDGCIDSSDARLRGLYALLKDELRSVYDAHKYVCARFVGTEVSLVSKTSAVAVIDRLKEQRSRLL